MTQQELGDELNYTDKAVSKWERGESVPDVSVLLKVANLFGVTLDYLVTDHMHADAQVVEDRAEVSCAEGREVRLVVTESEREPAVTVRTAPQAPEAGKLNSLAALFGYTPGKFTVALMSAASVWLAAVITFVVLTVFVPSFTKAWMCFVFAVPASILVLLIFNLIWGEMRYSFTLMSALLWTGIASVFIFFFDKSQNWILFLIGIPAQILLLLWSKLYKRTRE